jgi:hypothetical protein
LHRRLVRTALRPGCDLILGASIPYTGDLVVECVPLGGVFELI